jgi:two-component system chemotaxis sensor kinase CheA
VDDLTREFLLESQEGLDRMERCLTDLESRPAHAELLAEIFRSVHTIKGTTGLLGFPRLEALAHTGENLLGLLRDARLAVNPDIVSGLLALLDRLRGILRAIETNGAEGDPGLEDRVMIVRLEALQRNETTANIPETAADALDAPAVAQTAAAPTPARRRKSAARLSPRQPPRQSVRRAASPPKVSPLRDPVTRNPGQAGPPRNELAPRPEEPEPASASAAADSAPFPRPTISTQPSATPEPAPPSATPAASAAADSTLRVDIELLNRIMNLVGELVLTRNQILQAAGADAAFAPLARRLDMVTADLREAVMKARMYPVSHLF